MQAVALISLQKPGFELHHPGFILRAALAGDDLETIPVGICLGKLCRREASEVGRMPAMDQILPQPEHEGAVARAHQLLRGVSHSATVT